MDRTRRNRTGWPGRALLRLVPLVLLAAAGCSREPPWRPDQLAVIDSLALDRLGPAPADPSNRFARQAAAAALGERLFHDRRLSADGRVACATCHRPEQHFADPSPRSRGLGLTRRHAPSLLGAAWSDWFYWDGRRDSLWAQALTPIEHPDEQGLPRRAALRVLAADPYYAAMYRRVFGEPPPSADSDATAAGNAQAVDQAFANLGKALAAFVTELRPAPGRFDRYAAALRRGGDGDGLLSPTELAGLDLFIGRAQCVTCHNGPLLTNQGFHNVGTAEASARPPDQGRWQGIREVRQDPFNCLGAFSDAEPAACALRYLQDQGAQLQGAFKVPTLRNVALTAPYMHDGRFADLRAVIDHYAAAPSADRLGHQEILPLTLTGTEREALVAFLRTLSGAADDQASGQRGDAVSAGLRPTSSRASRSGSMAP